MKADGVTVVVFHSMFGLRAVERAAVARLQGAGYRAVAPDLFAGAVAGDGSRATLEEGFALMETIGWETITQRARAAVSDLPATTVLCGLSMGAGVVGALWPERLDAAAGILLHAATTVPAGVTPMTPVHLHVADDDARFAPAAQLAAFRKSAEQADAHAALYTYPRVGHLFTDAELPDYDLGASNLAWRRIRALLETLR